MKDMPICRMANGETATVLRIDGDGGIRRRFLDLGIRKGARVKKLFTSPLRDPACYMVGGVMIALRKVDAEKIIIVR